MLPLDPNVFQTAAGKLALEKYAAVTHLSIRICDRNRHIIAEQRGSNRLFELFSATPEDRKRALAAGFQIHMAKPLKLDEVVRAIATLIGSKSIASYQEQKAKSTGLGVKRAEP